MDKPKIGDKFYLWEIVGIPAKHSSYQMWNVRCDCGAERTVRASNVLKSKSRCCGSVKCVRKVQELFSTEIKAQEEFPIEIGQKFHKLIVLGTVDPTVTGKQRFLCKCTCGETSIETGYDLYTGRRGSCGKARFAMKVGEKFGELTVTHIDPTDPTLITCTCVCGDVEEFRRKRLRAGNIKTCAKKRRNRKANLLVAGDKYGQLTIIDKAISTKNDGHSYYNCKCSCGNTCVKRKDILLRSPLINCGCVRNYPTKVTLPSEKKKSPKYLQYLEKKEKRRLAMEKKQLEEEEKDRAKRLAKAPKLKDHFSKPPTSIFDYLVQTTKG